MTIRSAPFLDRSKQVYRSVANDAAEAFRDPSTAAAHETSLVNLRRLLERFKYDAFTMSYPPGVLEGVGARPFVTSRPRFLELAHVKQALETAYGEVYEDQDKGSVVDQLQSKIEELIDANKRAALVAGDEQLQRAAEFLSRLSARL